MKKLNKLEFTTKRILKNEELIVLKGGYDDGCTCNCYDWDGTWTGSLGSSTALSCNADCIGECGHGYGNWAC